VSWPGLACRKLGEDGDHRGDGSWIWAARRAWFQGAGARDRLLWTRMAKISRTGARARKRRGGGLLTSARCQGGRYLPLGGAGGNSKTGAIAVELFLRLRRPVRADTWKTNLDQSLRRGLFAATDAAAYAFERGELCEGSGMRESNPWTPCPGVWVAFFPPKPPPRSCRLASKAGSNDAGGVIMKQESEAGGGSRGPAWPGPPSPPGVAGKA